MQKNKFTIIILSLFIFVSFAQAQQNKNELSNNIEIKNLYTPKSDEKSVYDTLFPLITPYLQNIITKYNMNVDNSNNQLQTVFISELFRSRLEQRKSHFTFLTTGRGLISFFQFYDKYNNQFAVQFLHIVMPVFGTPQATKRLMGTLNKSLDRTLKTPFQQVGEEYISDYLLSRLEVENLENFLSSNQSIQEVAKDASTFYDLDKDFIIAVKQALTTHIQKKLHVSEKIAQQSAQSNFNYLLASEIFRNIQPELKSQGQKLFNHPTIGGELTQWFKTAPAFSKHSIIGVSDKDINNLSAFLHAGNKLQFALDLDMNTNKSLDGSEVFNPNYIDNELENLKKTFFAYPQFKTGDYYLTFIPEKYSVSNIEKAIHIELTISKTIVANTPTPAKDIISIDFSAPTQEPTFDNANSIVDAPLMEKNFELPNKDSKIAGKSRNLNLDTYNNILGDSYTGQDKNFENRGENTINPSINSIEPKEIIPNPIHSEDDDDLDTEISQKL